MRSDVEYNQLMLVVRMIIVSLFVENFIFYV